KGFSNEAFPLDSGFSTSALLLLKCPNKLAVAFTVNLDYGDRAPRSVSASWPHSAALEWLGFFRNAQPPVAFPTSK
ncbi:hypothetical protein PI125_g26556, partial [Phytophthora idaei]